MITDGVLILGSYMLDRKNQEIKKLKLWRNSLVIGAIVPHHLTEKGDFAD
jgi:hypothetical protein